MPGEKSFANRGQLSQAAQEMFKEIRDLPLDEADAELASIYAQMTIDGIDQEERFQWLNASIPDERQRTATRALAAVIAVEHVVQSASSLGERMKHIEEILAERGITLAELIEKSDLEESTLEQIILDIRQSTKPQV